MLKPITGFLILAASLALTPAAAADDAWPDLTGEWAGTSESVVRGDPLHHEGGETPHLSEVAFTLKIEGQEGRRFWGVLVSPNDSEPVVGVIANDRQSIYLVDLDGYAVDTLIDDNTLEHCYLQANANVQVAACVDFTRQP
jgi:hypothetical protein